MSNIYTATGQPSPKPSVVIQPLGEVIPQLEKTIEHIANSIHEAVDHGDQELVTMLREAAMRELDRYEIEETERDAERANWICPVMRSTVYDALGDYEAGLRCDLESLKQARTDVERAKSAINACIGYRRLGDYEQAIVYGKMACDLLPDADWTWIYLALASYKAGHKAMAAEIISALAAQTDINDPNNVLRIHLRFEREIAEMEDLPRVQELRRQVA